MPPKKGIHFQLEFYYPEDSCINAFDISVILNNALQNALENTPQERTPGYQFAPTAKTTLI